MKIRLLCVAFLIGFISTALCETSSNFDRFMKAFDNLMPFYAPYVDAAGQQGFFKNGIYSQLKAGLGKNPKFMAELRKYYRDPELYFGDFKIYTTAFSCYTFSMAMGDKSPDDYYRELEATKKDMEDAGKRTDISGQQKATIAETVSNIELFQKRIREYQTAASTVGKSTMSEVMGRAEELGKLFQKVFSKK